MEKLTPKSKSKKQEIYDEAAPYNSEAAPYEDAAALPVVDKVEKKKIEKKIFKAAVVETTRLMEAQARDIGDHKMTETKEDRSSNWFKRTLTRIWKHNIAQEYYRHKEIARAKKSILEKNDLYVGEEGVIEGAQHKQAMDAVLERFTSEYEDEMLKKSERDSKENIKSAPVNRELKKLVSEYASNPRMTRAAFDEEKTRILSDVDPSYAKKGNLHADNLFDIATEVRNSVEHGTKLEEMDFDVDLVLGKAQESLNTKAKENTFEKMQNSKVGRILMNEPTVAAVCAGAYNLASQLGVRALRSKAAAWGSFGATALLSGGLSAAKERARLERERAQHSREKAKGMVFNESDMERRQEMELNRYETRSAKEMIVLMESNLALLQKGKVDSAKMQEIFNTLADLESRIKLGDQRKIDLIAYSHFSQVEQERTDLDLLRAKTKIAFRKIEEKKALEFTETKFNEHLDSIIGARVREMMGGAAGIEAKDKIFRKLKNTKAAKAFIKTALVGAGIGFAVQEIGALVDGNQDGILEGTVKSIKEHLPDGKIKSFLDDHIGGLDKKATAIEGLRRTIFGDSPRMPFGEGHEMLINGTHMQLPDGVEMIDNHNGTFDIVRDGEVLSDNLPIAFNPDGSLTESTKYMLAKDDIFANFAQTGARVSEEVKEHAAEYLKNNPELTHTVHRDLWYDNDTPKPVFDKNELKLWWGGNSNAGVDANGNFVFNVQHMTPDGSYHDLDAVDAQDKIKTHGLKMIFSLTKDTQDQVFEVPIDDHGNAIIDKDSPIAKLMFENKDGHAIFKGQYAEVAQSMDTVEGVEHARILATHVGEGRDMIEDTIVKDTTVSNIRLDVPDNWDYDVPYFIPLVPRRPLERGSNVEAVARTRTKEAFMIGGIYDESYLDRDSIYEDPGIYEDAAYDETGRSIFYDDKYAETPGEKVPANNLEGGINHMQEYLGKKVDMKLMQELNGQIGEPMDNATRMSVVLPCYHEAKNIYKTLADWTIAQKDLKPEELEIITFVNAPTKDQPLDAETIAEIARFKKDNPQYKIRLVTHNFDFKAGRKMGAIYKTPTDLALYRNMQRLEQGASKEIVSAHLLRSGGADALGRNPKFLREVIDFMNKHPEIEQMRTQSAYPSEVREKFPLFNLVTVFSHSLSAMYTRGNSNIGLGTFRARAYAEASGFDPERDSREEIDLGVRMRRKIGKNKNAITKLVKKNAIDNPRRELFALAKGDTVLRAYKDFSTAARDKELRGFDWNKELPPEMKKNIEINPQNMNREFDAYFQHYQGKIAKESGIVTDILRGALNEKTLNSKRLHPETRLVLNDPEVRALIKSIDKKRKAGEEITRSSEEIKKITAQITKKFFDRILKVVLKMEKGGEADYDYITAGDGSTHIEFKEKAVEKLSILSKAKWDNFNGYWKNGDEEKTPILDETKFVKPTRVEKVEVKESDKEAVMSQDDFRLEMSNAIKEMLRRRDNVATLESLTTEIRDGKIVASIELKTANVFGGSPRVDLVLESAGGRLILADKPRIRGNYFSAGPVGTAAEQIPSIISKTLEDKYDKRISKILIEDGTVKAIFA